MKNKEYDKLLEDYRKAGELFMKLDEEYSKNPTEELKIKKSEASKDWHEKIVKLENYKE